MLGSITSNGSAGSTRIIDSGLWQTRFEQKLIAREPYNADIEKIEDITVKRITEIYLKKKLNH